MTPQEETTLIFKYLVHLSEVSHKELKKISDLESQGEAAPTLQMRVQEALETQTLITNLAKRIKHLGG